MHKGRKEEKKTFAVKEGNVRKREKIAIVPTFLPNEVIPAAKFPSLREIWHRRLTQARPLGRINGGTSVKRPLNVTQIALNY